ncbi:MAG: hypothetical protein JKY09_04130 [Crocinitomicaceae bacterium]|nr:hypothetical protein [Crocinitomicaceae bacterium]
MKLWSGILIGGAVFFTGRYLISLNRASKKVVVQISGRVHKVTLKGIEVFLDYNIKNPTRSNMEMAVPLIKLSHAGQVLVSSSMALVDIPDATKSANGRIKIKPFQETGTITTSVLLPYLSLIGVRANLVATLKDRLNGGEKKIKFVIETNTMIFTSVGNFPYDEKQVIEL